MTSSPRSFVCSIDVVVVGHFPHSLLPWLFLLRFIKCPLNGPIVRPINPFLSTELRSPAPQTPASTNASVLAHAICDDASFPVPHGSEEDSAEEDAVLP